MPGPLPSRRLLGVAANDDELELGGLSMLEALWRDPARYSRNRHFRSWASPEGRQARREYQVCQSVIRLLGQGQVKALAVRVQPEGTVVVELVLRPLSATRTVRLSAEAWRLLRTHPLAADLVPAGS